ncbi:MAG: ABC transporter ATP-binding protein [Syntrophorhabdaceae bacterium]|nr:ABC transporter ATP-binding protein [Syntrophorhabdaceae bacterium]
MKPSLSARDVYFRYGEQDVLRGVDIDLYPGEVSILLGPNGAGKSTLIGVLSGMLRPCGGEAHLFGRPPLSYPRREMARLLSAAGQKPPADFPMTVKEYVELGRFAHQGFFGGMTQKDRERVEEALCMSELSGMKDRLLSEISAGERQRAVVARAIAQDAAVMLLDEPTAFLDIRHRVAFHEIVARLAEKQGAAVLVASHDLSLCAEYGRRIILLSDGKTVAQGTPDEVLTPQNIRAAYGISVVRDRNPATGAVRVTPLKETGLKQAFDDRIKKNYKGETTIRNA